MHAPVILRFMPEQRRCWRNQRRAWMDVQLAGKGHTVSERRRCGPTSFSTHPAEIAHSDHVCKVKSVQRSGGEAVPSAMPCPSHPDPTRTHEVQRKCAAPQARMMSHLAIRRCHHPSRQADRRRHQAAE
jgi:hypothetical protein